LYVGNQKILPEKTASESVRQEKNEEWITSFKNKTQSPGSFIYAGPVTETILLGAVALRAGERVYYSSPEMNITNIPEANKYLVREYRKGWEL